jgi:hypothetical protein
MSAVPGGVGHPYRRNTCSGKERICGLAPKSRWALNWRHESADRVASAQVPSRLTAFTATARDVLVAHGRTLDFGQEVAGHGFTSFGLGRDRAR